jgi:hypothetical protein
MDPIRETESVGDVATRLAAKTDDGHTLSLRILPTWDPKVVATVMATEKAESQRWWFLPAFAALVAIMTVSGWEWFRSSVLF